MRYPLLIAALLVLAAPAKADTITIVADEWCPYNCAPSAEKQGILIEIAKYAFENKGHKIEYKIVPWARAIEEAREDKYTAIAGAAKGDAPDFVFPEVHQSQSVMTFFSKAGTPWRYNGMDSLKDISLGAINSYAYGDEIDAYIKANKEDMSKIQLLGGDTALADNVSKLLKGRVDAVLESENVMNHFLTANSLSDKIKAAGHLPLTEDQSLYIAFSPKHPKAKEFAKILSDATDELNENGKMAEILNRYGLAQKPATPSENPAQ